MERTPRNRRFGNPALIASPWAERTEQVLAIQAWATGGDEGRSALPRVVLTGVGGIGKTQIATAVYHELSPRLDLSLWVLARSLEEVVAAYAQAERSLTAARPKPDKSPQAPGDLTGDARRFLTRLEDKAVLQSWLVVLDDLSADEEMEHWWPPVNDHGRTLVTCRRFGSAAGRADTRVIEVAPLPFSESITLLRSSLPAELSAEDAVALDGLARQSQGLPLAVSQIASLLRHSSLTVDEVLHRLVDPGRLAQTYLISGRLAEAEHQLVALLEAQQLSMAKLGSPLVAK